MKTWFPFLLFATFLASLTGVCAATNGDNLLAIGPVARAMGGVGIASPQDAISAVFSNPAAMCFGPYCPGSEANISSTFFMPKVDACVATDGSVTSAKSERTVYAIPAIGLSVPLRGGWRFGLSAYGVSGLGVDYRGTVLERAVLPTPGGLGTTLRPIR